MKVGIVGLGLIGGSLGLALKDEKLISCVSGYDIKQEHQSKALELGLVHEILTLDEMKRKCDIIFLAIPVEAIIQTMQNLNDISDDTTIIDFGSTKQKIIQAVPKEIRKNFIPAHPMAGTEYSGPEAAFKSLYKDAVVVVCDFEESSEKHVKRSVELFSHLGMKIVFMSAKEHDHHVGIISHLPHAIAFSLASGVLKEEDTRHIMALGGPTFRGMIRVAKSSPIMWSDIFKQNKDNILEAIKIFKNELSECEKLVQNEQWNELYDWMSQARKIREIL
ncbi:prephenate dehydrogenase [Campylobacter sp. RM9344]|uniref:Prephenate dehydrogenase n=1 Tax=Campylobacter californiensis TaxID=1032243 RepID=A0AAW3ZQZ1_9BACT|nr:MULTISPECIES: prephenate dehydrogenase [unclassified Campylobacter]MBE2984391.1 prephenate dehydrogenase [Campylobacter sp. RM6883]MBE2985729.1 prephenate dehydrogenase [Campylobacter sp. RM12919]MBE2988751.1 prephenate dehydrogenase [Campylobacter sp. RM12920]MBE2995826.1 prephenate dehydrogenase [Campylobacter sp. RM6913]MBE3021777.1 prephenate dehydrogenase [Campylobacter sp. 7477a]MBE3029657.1 prephenate dehydrogenase [Campylobacter sp. RM9344]